MAKKYHHFVNVLAVAAFATASACSEPEPEVIAQARPVVAWLRAAKTSDIELLKTVWSKRHLNDSLDEITQPKEDEHWKNTLENYRKLWAKAFGDYQISEFVFGFSGDEASGLVTIEFKGKKLPGILVVKEGEVWKVDER